MEHPQVAWARCLQSNATTDAQVDRMIKRLQARGIAHERAVYLVIELLRCDTYGWRN